MAYGAAGGANCQLAAVEFVSAPVTVFCRFIHQLNGKLKDELIICILCSRYNDKREQRGLNLDDALFFHCKTLKLKCVVQNQ